MSAIFLIARVHKNVNFLSFSYLLFCDSEQPQNKNINYNCRAAEYC